MTEAMQEGRERRSLTPLFPTYSSTRAFLSIIEGEPEALFRSMVRAILEQRGTVQDPVNWSDPDTWIDERLRAEEQRLARRLWQGSGGLVNPRHMRGLWWLSRRHNLLLTEDVSGKLSITERGKDFLTHPEGQVEAEIDAYEGILFLLRAVAELGPAKRGALAPRFGEFCRDDTHYEAERVISSSLAARLSNLIDRKMVIRRGTLYEITEKGLDYLQKYSHLSEGVPKPEDGQPSPQSELQRLANRLTTQAREQLRDYLLEIDPYRFEGLIKYLLEEMGYTNVQVTAPSNDKGVDVIADIELGVSQVREVIQVKRHRGSIGRPVLDQLRGVLHRFRAVRGTIITTGTISPGARNAAFEVGAAPITLIDGEKLLDLLTENQIGIVKRAVEYLEFDPQALMTFDEEQEEA